MQCFKSAPCLPVGRLALLMVVAAISLGIMGIKPAEASGVGVIAPINEVRMVDGDGIPIRSGDLVTIEGIVTVCAGVISTRHTIIFVEDKTGGIRLFAPDEIIGIRQGDQVRVSGIVGHHWRGTVRLEDPDIEILSRDNPLPAPQPIGLRTLKDFATAEPLEGELVQTYVRISRVPDSPRGGTYSIYVTDVQGGEYYFSGLFGTIGVGLGTNIDVSALRVGDIYRVTGILSQIDRFRPYHEGYRIFPRSEDDLQLVARGVPLQETTFPITKTVRAVVDGDGITLKTPVVVDGGEIFEVRFLGIDAPEVFIGKDPIGDQIEFGERAADKMAMLLPPGTEVTLKVDQRIMCGLGRLLAFVYREDLNINEEMLRQGKVASFVVWPNSYYEGRFEALRRAMLEAKHDQRGIRDAVDPLDELPVMYRYRFFGRGPRYIGDFGTKRYVRFKDMEQIAIENRIYFFSYTDVIASGFASGGGQSGGRNVIFFHPDGYGLSHWNALRFWLVGPDGRLNWDKLPYMAPYTEHMKDALTASSHGGATVHAYGVKVARDSFGLDEHQVITALSGRKMTIMEEAIEAGFATALIGSGCLTEPGTAVFVASVEERHMREEIAKQVIESGVEVILSGGERWLLPRGLSGRHGEGRRTDGLNLIERARELGYTVVYTREELMEVAANSAVTRVLGVFAAGHTFNCKPEEVLRAEGWPYYWLWAPTIYEMARATLEILARNPRAQEKGIFLVAEEEGTDNFPNNANARGSFEAGRRADEAFGVFIEFVENNPDTLLITTADSSAGGKHILERVRDARVNTGSDGEWVKAPLDGIDGAGSEPFLSAADREGNRFPFKIAWASSHDLAGGIVVRAQGLNAELITKLGVVDNTDIYRLIYYTLFDEWPGKRTAFLYQAKEADPAP